MNAEELHHLIGNETSGKDLVMVLTEGGIIYSIIEIERETHDDADGSSTVWIKVEEI